MNWANLRSENKIHNKMSMIVNPSDPTGLGLFSKCARNHAMKSKALRPASASKSKSVRPIEPVRKTPVTFDSFSKQQSREQRQKKYKRGEAPPVGQYNPTQRERPKLVWDILKAYQHQLRKKKNTELQEEQKEDTKQPTATAALTENELEAMITTGEAQQHPHLLSTGESGSLMSSKGSQCMVNMSRMTGRKEKVRESYDWGDANVLQSLAYVKGSISRCIVFDKMQDFPSDPRSNINPASNYTYDYRLLKQRKSALLDFSAVRGREEKPKQESSYSYQHYDYDSYVWEKQSKVYPNTKTHLIEFTRQTNRYSHHQ